MLFSLGGLLVAALGLFIRERREARASALAACRTQAGISARQIDRRLRSMEGLAHGIALDLEAGKLPVAGIQARLAKDLGEAPSEAFRMGVLFQPYAAGKDQRLMAPFVERRNPGVHAYDFLADGDYTTKDWYQADLKTSGWNAPYRHPSSGDLVVPYSEPVRLPGATDVSGVVGIEISLKDFQPLVAAMGPDSSGYAFLLSAQGVYLADPIQARVREAQTIEGVGRAMGDPGRLRLAQAAAHHRADQVESISGPGGKPTWVILEPIQASGWSLGIVVLLDQLRYDLPDMNLQVMKLVSLTLLVSLTALFLALGLPSAHTPRLWSFALGASCLMAVGTVSLWHFAYTLRRGTREQEIKVTSQAGLRNVVERYRKIASGLDKVDSIFVPTGVFIQKMEMVSGNMMKISGQVWQKYPEGFPKERQGISFPEASACDFGPTASEMVGSTRVDHFPFRGTFAMPAGSNVNYPFDRTQVRLRIWNRKIYGNIILVPDLDSYTILAPASLPGIDNSLTLSGWSLGESHFSFLIQSYNTSFGLPDKTGQQDSPELMYSVSLKRNFTNPFIATFLPIFVVAGMLFGLMATTTVLKERVSAFGYSVMNVLRTLTSLFFPVVLSQVNLRNHVPSEGLLIVEYYYFAIYGMLLLATANSMAVALWDKGFHRTGDNLIPKLLFLPSLSAVFYAISTLYLW
ncbi:cache domain-containing protein [Mesoterricola silvestris]|uniref:Cache domain-containing protein n=1 Tax=Mesoterricola silvestris TaxID=2927979 RepID=A0AA48KAB9_9BACT|nr:cache domain-containing protein [Mesoterricola silvestris]BDU74466.1 hypothetical protein METEAL_36400 [Mesoterricola silvestris]